MNIFFQVTNEFIQNELSAGRIQKKQQNIKVEWENLDKTTRDLLIKHCVINVESEKAFVGIFKKPNLFSQNEVWRADYTAECYGNTLEAIIESILKNEKQAETLIAYREDIVSRFNALKEKYSTADFKIYLQNENGENENGENENIDFIYKNVYFTPGLWTKLNVLETADSDGSLAVWIKSVDEENEKENILKAKKEAEKVKKEAEKEEFKKWALENGSELLKLRIKHNQNWLELAETEWAIAHTEGFERWNLGDSDDYVVKNATVQQLKELDAAKTKYPDYDIDIIRCKFVDEEDRWFRTFLRCEVKTPTNNKYLYKEINDVSEDNE